MKSRTLTCITVTTLFAVLALPIPLTAQDNQDSKDDMFITFDAPGAILTFAFSINPAGTVTGYCLCNGGQANHSYFRSPNGILTTFDVPGAVNGTFAVSINPAGTITGSYLDAKFVPHGFLRAESDRFITFDVPGTVNGTSPVSINPAGAITGSYQDTKFVPHGFLRAESGSITTFDVPGAVNGTFPVSINPAGTITGSYLDANFVSHGFLRSANGTFVTFDPIASITTLPTSINEAGTITGGYADANSVFHGFLRRDNSSITTFNAPGAGNSNSEGTEPFHSSPNINPAGTITGSYLDANFVWHGYLRARNGSFTIFNAPGAGRGSGQGTIPQSINPSGVITGYYFDASGAHGFLRKKGDLKSGHEQ